MNGWRHQPSINDSIVKHILTSVFNTEDANTLAKIHEYCNSMGLPIHYGRTAAFGVYDPCYKIELPFSSPHITYILLHFELEFKLVS
jgi:hypothetical protein